MRIDMNMKVLRMWIQAYVFFMDTNIHEYIRALEISWIHMNTDTPLISMNIHGYPTAAYKSYCGGKKIFKRKGETKSGDSGEFVNMQHTAYLVPNLGNLYSIGLLEQCSLLHSSFSDFARSDMIFLAFFANTDLRAYFLEEFVKARIQLKKELGERKLQYHFTLSWSVEEPEWPQDLCYYWLLDYSRLPTST